MRPGASAILQIVWLRQSSHTLRLNGSIWHLALVVLVAALWEICRQLACAVDHQPVVFCSLFHSSPAFLHLHFFGNPDCSLSLNWCVVFFSLSDQQIKGQSSYSVFLLAYIQESHLNGGENPTFSIWGAIRFISLWWDLLLFLWVFEMEKNHSLK